MQDDQDPVRFKGHHGLGSSSSNKSPNHRRRAHGNITHTDPRAHLGIRLGLFWQSTEADLQQEQGEVEEVEVLPVQSFPLPLHSPL